MARMGTMWLAHEAYGRSCYMGGRAYGELRNTRASGRTLSTAVPKVGRNRRGDSARTVIEIPE
jgi:hypothetical protein